LAALYVAHSRELEIFLNRRVRCPHTAADLVQETFLRLAQQPDGAGEDNPRSYLYRTAKNLAIDHFRKQDRRDTFPAPAEQLAETADEAPTADRTAEARERLDLLMRAMAELPPRTQRIFRMNRIDGVTYAEIARRLEISESAVQKHLSKALQHAIRRLKSLK